MSNYPVSCKHGVLRMHVINPTCYTLDPTKYVQSILLTFTGDKSVLQKRANTEAFLLTAAKDPVGAKRRASMISKLKMMIEDATAAAIARVREIDKQRLPSTTVTP